jgi:hypothetical protein
VGWIFTCTQFLKQKEIKMEDLFDSDDIPVAWPKELPQLKNIDDRLHCPICYSYMKNPVISTACSHNCNLSLLLL